MLKNRCGMLNCYPHSNSCGILSHAYPTGSNSCNTYYFYYYQHQTAEIVAAVRNYQKYILTLIVIEVRYESGRNWPGTVRIPIQNPDIGWGRATTWIPVPNPDKISERSRQLLGIYEIILFWLRYDNDWLEAIRMNRPRETIHRYSLAVSPLSSSASTWGPIKPTSEALSYMALQYVCKPDF